MSGVEVVHEAYVAGEEEARLALADVVYRLQDMPVHLQARVLAGAAAFYELSYALAEDSLRRVETS